MEGENERIGCEKLKEYHLPKSTYLKSDIQQFWI